MAQMQVAFTIPVLSLLFSQLTKQTGRDSTPLKTGYKLPRASRPNIQTSIEYIPINEIRGYFIVPMYVKCIHFTYYTHGVLHSLISGGWL